MGERVVKKVGAFFGPVPGSIRGHLNFEELVRIFWTAVLATGTVLLSTRAVRGNWTELDQPNWLELITFLMLSYAEFIRRLSHGQPLPPVS